MKLDARALLRRMGKGGLRLCFGFIPPAEGLEPSPFYWLEPGGERVKAAFALQMIEAGAVTPPTGDLFGLPANGQVWVVKPLRIQRQRTRGWSGEEAAGNGLPIKYVNRPLRYGNPHRVEAWGHADATAMFERDLMADALPFSCEEIRRDFRGKNVGCFCGLDEPCHGNVILRIANS